MGFFNRRKPREYEAVNYAVPKILTSELLLDEDQSIVLTYWEICIKDHRECDVNYTLLYTLIAGLSLAVNFYKKNVLITGLCSTPIAFDASMKIYCYCKFRHYQGVVDNLLKAMSDVYNFMKKVIRYLKEREGYLSRTRPVLSDFLFTVLMNSEKSFATIIFNSFQDVTIAVQRAIQDICVTNPVCANAYEDIINLNLKEENVHFDNGNFAPIIKDTFYKYCMVMSNFLGSLVIKLVLEMKQEQSFYIVMDTTVKNLIKSLEETLHHEVTFQNKIKVLPSPSIKEDRGQNKKTVLEKKVSNEVLMYFKIGHELAKILDDNIEVDQTACNNSISAIIEHLKMSNNKIGLLEMMMLMQKPPQNVAKPLMSNEEISENPAPPPPVMYVNEIVEDIKDEVFECVVLDESDAEDDYVMNRSDAFENSAEMLKNNRRLIAELNLKLDKIRKHKELMKEPLKKETSTEELPSPSYLIKMEDSKEDVTPTQVQGNLQSPNTPLELPSCSYQEPRIKETSSEELPSPSYLIKMEDSKENITPTQVQLCPPPSEDVMYQLLAGFKQIPLSSHMFKRAEDIFGDSSDTDQDD